MPDPLLEVRGLADALHARRLARAGALRGPPEVLRAVDGVDLEIAPRRGARARRRVGLRQVDARPLHRRPLRARPPARSATRASALAAEARRAPQRRRIQMVFQDPYSSLNPRMTVRQTLSELLRVHKMVPRSGVDARCRELLDLVGLAAARARRPPAQLLGRPAPARVASPARSRSSPSCSSPTSRSRRSTCRCRRRC